MANRIIDEEMRFSIIVNGNQAQKELFDLENSTRKLTATNKDLRAEQARLVSEGKKSTQAYKNVTAEIKENNIVLKANKAQMKVLQGQIGITGLTMAQLSSKANALKLQLRNMVPGSAQYKKLEAELQQVGARMSELRGKAQATKLSIGSIADGFSKYAALGASVIAMTTGVVLSLQKMIDYNGKLSDAQSNVQKTTGLTKQEVDELTKSFGLLKTRTARIELLELAEEAGRLGISGTKNIADFVEVANQLKVALGDDLSTEAIREVGKLSTIYKVGEKTGRDFKNALLSIGSAINEVSASGANTADFLVDYLKRQAGVAIQTKISAESNLGYAATFDELGQSVEVSATAMNKIWIDMFDNADVYAKIAGVSLQEFTTLLNTDANEAMKLFLKGLNGNEQGLKVMIDKLKDLEAGGARGVQALLALASNTDLLEKRQTTANKAMVEAISLTNEYNLKNNNLAAILEKIKKTTLGWFSSDGLVSFLTAAAKGFAQLTGATEDSTAALQKERLEVLLLESKIKDINTTQEDRLDLIREFKKMYPNYLKDLEAEKVSNEQITEAIKGVNQELVNKIILQKKDAEVEKQTYNIAERKMKVLEQEDALRIKLALFSKKHNKSLQEGLSLEGQSIALIKELEYDRLKGHFNLSKQSISGMNDFRHEVYLLQQQYKALNAQEKSGIDLSEQRAELLKRLGITIAKPASTGVEPPAGPKNGDLSLDGTKIFLNGKWVLVDDNDPGTNGDKKAALADATEKAKQEAIKRAEDLLKLQREAEDLRLAVMQEGFDKEMILEDFNHYRKIEDLQGKLVDEALIKKTKDENLKASYIAHNKAINSQIESELQLHNMRVGTITEKGVTDSIAQKQTQFEREKQDRLIAHNNELAALGENDKAKKALQKEFDNNEANIQKSHLELLTAELKKIIDSGNFEGFDLNLLSDEQIQAIKDKLAELGLSLSQINALIGQMKGETGDRPNFDGEVDVLGFSTDQWVKTFENLDSVEGKIRAAEMAVGAFMNAWGMYNQFVTANQRKELEQFEKANETKKQKQKQLLDNGFINERQYNDAIKALEDEAAKRKAGMEFKAAKREKAMNVASAIANTAVSVSKALAQGGFVLGVPWAAIVGALGAIQIGLAASQPLPAKGYQDGYYNVQREQDGKLFNAAYGGESRTGIVDKPTVFLAGEQGKNFPEMIIDGRSFKQMNPDVKQALYGELARVRGYERGFGQSQTTTPQFQNQTTTTASTPDSLLTSTLLRTNELLDSLEKNGVSAFMDKSFRNIKKLQERLDEYEKIKLKNKI